MTEPMMTGVLEHVDPNTLSIETNVRVEAGLTKQFVASIKENGVLVPIVAVRDSDGVLHVRAGQRRTLAAREAGLATVPVYVTDADADDATRLVQQITENDQRLSLKATDRVKGIQTLLDTGLSVTKVAKRLAVSPERVKQSKAVASSQLAMEALQSQALTLAEAAAITEFEDDPDAVRRLQHAAEHGWFNAELERQRRARDEAAARAVATQEWADQGYTVLDRYPGYVKEYVPLRYLRTADGNAADNAAITNPQNWAVILSEDTLFLDAEGNPVDETTIDWAVEDDPETAPAEGMLHPGQLTEKAVYVPSTYFCLNPEAEGLAVDERFTKLAEATASLPDGAPAPSSTDDLERKEAEKAERRRVVTLNKAGAAAETVRRQFVAGLLKRKTPPEGAMTFVAHQVTRDGTLLGGHRANEIASELLGGSVRTGELLDHASDGRAQVILLGMTLGAMESFTPKSAWRSGSATSKEYLQFLAAHGYGLSPVERVVTGDLTADECLEELA